MWREIIKEIKARNNTLVAVSGGVDSMFLLDLVHRSGIEYSVVHFEHGNRIEDAAEMRFVQSICIDKYKVPFYTAKGEGIAEMPGSLEKNCRDQRYAFINAISEDFDYIFTAHHLNDQIENIFIRLMRGDPHHVLTIPKTNGKFYRPLLEVKKEKIIKQATNRGLVWMEDASNLDQRFDRNWLRHNIIPQFLERTNIMKSMLKGIEKSRTHA